MTEAIRDYAGTDFPTACRLKGLKPSAVQALSIAFERKVISTREITNLVARGVERDRERFAGTMAWFKEMLHSNNVRLVADKDEAAHHAQFPPEAKKQQIEFRRIARTSEDLPDLTRAGGKNDAAELAFQRLEKVGEQYEYDTLKRYYAEVKKFAILTQEQEAELGRRVLEDRDLDARNKLVEHNLRLVRWVANQYTWSKMDFEDLVQEGNTGLITAAMKYDYRVGRFTTYAVWWIRQGITRAIMNLSDVIRLPVHLHELHQKVLKASRELSIELGRVPTAEEVAQSAELSPERVRRVLVTTRITVVSLDSTIGVENPGIGAQDSQTTVGEMIPDENILSPEVYLEACDELKAAEGRLDRALEGITKTLKLPGRNVEIFKCFYGLDGSGTRRILDAVGQKFGVTRERIRQIIAKIWEKLDEQGGDMDHDRFIEEMVRIEALQKIVSSGSP